MAEPTFTVTCRRCGAEARNLNLVGLFTTPDLCPRCHEDGCPLARPHLYSLDEHPLECTCPDLRADEEEFSD